VLRFSRAIAGEIKGNECVVAVHEFLPFEPEETDMVRAEVEELAQWLGVPLTGLT